MGRPIAGGRGSGEAPPAPGKAPRVPAMAGGPWETGEARLGNMTRTQPMPPDMPHSRGAPIFPPRLRDASGQAGRVCGRKASPRSRSRRQRLRRRPAAGAVMTSRPRRERPRRTRPRKAQPTPGRSRGARWPTAQDRSAARPSRPPPRGGEGASRVDRRGPAPFPRGRWGQPRTPASGHPIF